MVRLCRSLIPGVSAVFSPPLCFLLVSCAFSVWVWLSNHLTPAANQPAHPQPIHSSSSCSIYTPVLHSSCHQIVQFASVFMLRPVSRQVYIFLVFLPRLLLILCLPVPQVHLLVSKATTQPSLPAPTVWSGSALLPPPLHLAINLHFNCFFCVLLLGPTLVQPHIPSFFIKQHMT